MAQDVAISSRRVYSTRSAGWLKGVRLYQRELFQNRRIYVALRDAEPEEIVGKVPVNSHSSTTAASSADADSEFTPIPLHTEEPKPPENQPVKQSYFTSILSSLPNLSLSSITGDTPGSQASQSFETNPQDRNPHLPPFDHRDPLTDTTPPPVPNFYEPRSTNFARSGDVYPGSSSSLPAPPQPPTAPPTIPTSGDGPISYRLGNQRRLKYAPPPELTSSTSKQYSAPAVQPVFTPQSVAPLSIFNPNEPIAAPVQAYQPVEALAATNSPSIERSTPEQLSQANSLQESFRSSPVASAVSYSSTGTPRSATPQSPNSGYESVPLRTAVPQSLSRPIPHTVPETVTPQNTPVNFSFPVFETYPIQPDFLTPTSTEKDAARSGPSQADDAHVARSNAPTPGAKPAVTFAPSSAIQISEKLEHLLQERKEESSKLATEELEKTAAEGALEAFEAVGPREVGEQSCSPKAEPAFPPPRESPACPEQQLVDLKPEAAQSHAAPSNVPSFPQFQQQAFPLTSSFLPEPAQQRSSLNYPLETSSSSAFAESQRSVQPASSFFESQDLGQFPPPPFNESNADPQLAIGSRNDPQQSSSSTGLYSYFDNPTVASSQAFWSTGPASNAGTAGATGSTQLAPPPQLYNPLQFQSELHKPPAPRFQPYVSPFVQSSQLPVNQAQHYFGSALGPPQTYDAAAENDTIFPPMPPGITNVPEPTGTATLSPVQMSINPHGHRTTPDSIAPDSQILSVDPSEKRMQYRAVYHHWFYRKEVEHKVLWLPFSMQDSLRLEEVHNSSEITPEITIATDGGRYDVDILRRQRSPVYWTGASTEVRRCSWFYKGSNESVYTPYEESIAAKLEEEYKVACMTNRWNRRIDLNNGEYIIFHGATVQLHYTTSSPEASGTWGNTTEDSAYLQGAASRPRTIKRGLDEFHIEDGEPEKVDHLLFLVHGIGSVCDLKFRSVEEVVDEFRSIALQLVQSHYRTASEQRVLNRIELLPVSWHTTLHSEDTGIDKKLQAITLPSIPKLRFFTNDTLLDILFYTSPVYCQTIMHTVGNEINRLFTLFKDRNPDFDGGIYLGGHSLGSLILFDLLCHQKPLSEEKSSADDNETTEEKNEEDNDNRRLSSKRVIRRRRSKKISYVMGAAGTGQPYIHYPQLNFQPRAFFALGSPIGMFVTVRGIDMLGEDFVLPTCPAFFNIFHPFDPVAYRVEALINLEASKYRPMLIPHHKGRKRMHLEVREIMARVGADLKQKLLASVWNTWNSVYSLAGFNRPDNSALEKEIDKVVEEQLQDTPTVSDHQSTDDGGADFKVGQLNGGRRIDYVLQEAPLESINEYIFAVGSHVCYWESEDTMLMILKEIYGSQGIQTDAQLPQHTIPMERATPSPSLAPSSPTFSKNSVTSPVPGIGIDPTAPASSKLVGPPPMCGFVKKS
ncbi:uncharacterized protein LOC117229259 isoform X2 [Megalopta genalis]|uniref:uncharacterized protein LOC117229259 isoform X2 n=1 Tax=Megalopta genalis TaxID=115081 RepID=UPI003FD4013B